MYNKYLDTFIKVAELGSFSKAAEALYITPSAVIQQMNNLENDLQTKLLVRTKQGTTLTEAGTLLYDRGREVVRISEETRREILAMQERQHSEITVGTTLIHKCRLLYELWIRFYVLLVSLMLSCIRRCRKKPSIRGMLLRTHRYAHKNRDISLMIGRGSLGSRSVSI